MEQAGRVNDQVIGRFGCQFGGRAGDRFGLLEVELRHSFASQRTDAGAAWILVQMLAERRAEGATGADHQSAITVAERGQGQPTAHGFAPAFWRRKNTVT